VNGAARGGSKPVSSYPRLHEHLRTFPALVVYSILGAVHFDYEFVFNAASHKL
jgi:hypothetical protein